MRREESDQPTETESDTEKSLSSVNQVSTNSSMQCPTIQPGQLQQFSVLYPPTLSPKYRQQIPDLYNTPEARYYRFPMQSIIMPCYPVPQGFAYNLPSTSPNITVSCSCLDSSAARCSSSAPHCTHPGLAETPASSIEFKQAQEVTKAEAENLPKPTENPFETQ